MTFNSISYSIFLPIVYFLFYVTGERYKWLILLISSYIFYGFLQKPSLLLVLTIVIFISFYFGKMIDRHNDRADRKKYVWLGICINLLLLIYFKYLPFLVQNLNIVFHALHFNISIPAPTSEVSIALSFFIFQAISYLADIYFKMSKPETNFGYLALYLSFFPKLLQGPIERGSKLLPQLKERFEFSYDNIHSGMLLFGWGLFKKVVVADRLALFVDPIYNDVNSYSGISLIIATYFYAFQIYFDFSGYTDMALGSARLFNINLTQNFNSPYLATSIADFWRRWHISLSRWILDYIFEPLQMQFRNWGKLGTAYALLGTFFICGVWHGASWGYIVWGLLHGIYLSTSIFYKSYQKKLYNMLNLQKSWRLKIWQTAVTFHLVCFTYIFFRATSLADALHVVKKIVAGAPGDLSRIMAVQGSFFQILCPVQSPSELLFALSLMVMVAIFSAIGRSQSPSASQIGGFAWLSNVPLPIRISTYAVLFYLFAFHGASTQSFIYLQF